MKIGYVKKVKKKKRRIKDYIYNLMIDIKSILNVVEQDKYKSTIFRIYNFSEISKNKLVRKLNLENINYVLVEQKHKIDFEKVDTKFLMQAMLPELVEKCYELVKPSLDEVYVCTNNFCEENIRIIREIIPKVKTVNIVTNNRQFRILERNLEDEGIYITVTNNRRKSLKNAVIVINLDFETLNEYNINRDMVLIDTTGKISIQKGFNGIIISRIRVDTKKVLRVFSEFENFDKSELIEAEIAKIHNYSEKRDFIRFNKIYIQSLYNNRRIEYKEFEKIKEFNRQRFNKKIPPQIHRCESEGR